jgi:hypothetical protein
MASPAGTPVQNMRLSQLPRAVRSPQLAISTPWNTLNMDWVNGRRPRSNAHTASESFQAWAQSSMPHLRVALRVRFGFAGGSLQDWLDQFPVLVGGSSELTAARGYV